MKIGPFIMVVAPSCNSTSARKADGSELRHGVAFSFETSQTLPSIEKLFPYVRRFNDYMQQHPSDYADMRMLHYRKEKRSSDYPPAGVMWELVKNGILFFSGSGNQVTRLITKSF